MARASPWRIVPKASGSRTCWLAAARVEHVRRVRENRNVAKRDIRPRPHRLAGFGVFAARLSSPKSAPQFWGLAWRLDPRHLGHLMPTLAELGAKKFPSCLHGRGNAGFSASGFACRLKVGLVLRRIAVRAWRRTGEMPLTTKADGTRDGTGFGMGTTSKRWDNLNNPDFVQP
jgi:hypothetical protein